VNNQSFLSKQYAMSVHKTAGFLSPNQIFELVWDSEREAGVSHLQLDRPTSSGQASSSSTSQIVSDEEEVFQSGSGEKWCGVKRKAVC
jgi:hypothetical protein